MVGHTGIYSAAVLAIEATDKAIGVIYEACKEHGYVMFVTADHGNAEKMIAEDGTPHTAHTCSRVPFVATGSRGFIGFEDGFALCDVAPSVLDVMGVELPKEMDGRSLIKKK